MTQSKKQSLKETLTNTFTGMAGSFAITMVCLWVFTFDISFTVFDYKVVIVKEVVVAAATTLLCTVWSIGRGYAIRRYFNKLHTKEVQQ